MLLKKKSIALQAINKVNYVQKSLLSEVLLNLLIAVGILIQDNGSKEVFIYIWYLMFCLRQFYFNHCEFSSARPSAVPVIKSGQSLLMFFV